MTYPIATNAVRLPDGVEDALASHCRIHRWTAIEHDARTLAQIQGYLVYGHPRIDAALMDRLPALRVISNIGVGVDHISAPDARARGIAVGNTPELLNGAVADMAFALMLAAARNIVTGDRFARSTAFTHYDPNLNHGLDVHGRTLGIIGMGRIGRQIARRAQAFDMSVVYYNRNRDLDAEAALNAQYAALPDLLNQSDFVVLVTPLTPATRNLIGAPQLRQMKSSAILVNVARGGVVDHDALLTALREGWIHAAALDVTEPEPLPRDHPLLALDNLVITPHLGSATKQTRAKMAQRGIDNLLRGLNGEALLSAIG